MRYVHGLPSTVPNLGANCVAFCNDRLHCSLQVLHEQVGILLPNVRTLPTLRLRAVDASRY